jgi:uncharacterized repeat protein (TIGR04076 family)
MQAKTMFEETVPVQFLKDTAEPEKDGVRKTLADSETFFRNCGTYQVVAEVVEAARCMAGVRVGDRYVIQGAAVDPDQSTGPNCIFLLSMLVQRVAAAFDRFGSDGDICMTLPGAQCTDPGPVVGGFGGVKVRMWIEPIP